MLANLAASLFAAEGIETTEAKAKALRPVAEKMITKAKGRGYITYDELNRVLPSDQYSSEQIEDVMSMLSEMGINVIEDDEVEDAEAAPAEEESGSSSYVPADKEKDTQLKYALDLLRGIKSVDTTVEKKAEAN